MRRLWHIFCFLLAVGSSAEAAPSLRYRSAALLSLHESPVRLQSLDGFDAWPDGSLLLRDAYGRLVILDAQGRATRNVKPAPGSILAAVRHFATLPDGNWVGAAYRDRALVIQRFDREGKSLGRPYPDLPQVDLRGAHQLAVVADGTVYLWEAGSRTVFAARSDRPEWKRIPLSSDAVSDSRIAFAAGPSGFYLAVERKVLFFSRDGARLTAFTLPEPPSLVTVDPEGSLVGVLGHDLEQRIVRYSPRGELLESLDLHGVAPGRLLDVRDLAVNAKGELFTVEQSMSQGPSRGDILRVQKWRLAPAPAEPRPVVRRAGAPSQHAPRIEWELFATEDRYALGELVAPVSTAGGHVLVGQNYSDYEVHPVEGGTSFRRARVLELDRGGRRVRAIGTELLSAGAREGRSLGPEITALARDRVSGRLYVAGVGEPSIRVFRKSGELETSLPLPPFQPQEGSSSHPPVHLSVSETGIVYAPDPQNGRIGAYHPKTRRWELFGAWGEGPGEYLQPVATSPSPRGGLFVADAEARRVIKLDGERRYQYELRLGAPGREEPPLDVAATDDGGVVVGYAASVARFSPEGRLLWHWKSDQALLYASDQEREGGIGLGSAGAVYIAARRHDYRRALDRTSLIKLNPASRSPTPPTWTFGERRWFGGAGRGQFNHPCGVAADRAGNIYVADFNNHRVQKFDSQGRFLLQFGVDRVKFWGEYYAHGLDASRHVSRDMKWPAGIAVDGERKRVYVAEWGGRRVRIHDLEGNFQRLLAEGLDPWGLAVGADGRVYVSDVKARQVRIFSPDGEALGTLGAEQGIRVGEPRMLAVRGSRLYVTDRESHEVVLIDLEGEREISRFGRDILRNPDGIAVDERGGVWVADTSNHRVASFDGAGRFQASATHYGEGTGGFRWPRGLGFDPKGSLFVADWGNDAVHRLALSGGTRSARWGSFSTQNAMRTLGVVTAAPFKGALFVGGGLIEPRTGTVLTTFGQRRDVGFHSGKTFARAVFPYPADALVFEDRLITLHSETAEGGLRLGIFAPTGISQASFPLTFGANPSNEDAPGARIGLYLRSQMSRADDMLAITDPRGEVVLVDLLGQVRRRFGKGVQMAPGGIVALPGGSCFVSDPYRHRVLRFDRNGRKVGQFGKPGPNAGELLFPTSLAAGPDGTLYVLDRGNRRVKRFDVRGKLLGISAPLPGEDFSRLQVGGDGTVYLADGLSLATTKPPRR